MVLAARMVVVVAQHYCYKYTFAMLLLLIKSIKNRTESVSSFVLSWIHRSSASEESWDFNKSILFLALILLLCALRLLVKEEEGTRTEQQGVQITKSQKKKKHYIRRIFFPRYILCLTFPLFCVFFETNNSIKRSIGHELCFP